MIVQIFNSVFIEHLTLEKRMNCVKHAEIIKRYDAQNGFKPGHEIDVKGLKR